MHKKDSKEYEWLWEKIEEKIWEALEGWKLRLWKHSVPSPETDTRLKLLEDDNKNFLKWRVFAWLMGMIISLLLVVTSAVFSKLEAMDDDQEAANIQQEIANIQIEYIHEIIKRVNNNDSEKNQSHSVDLSLR